MLQMTMDTYGHMFLPSGIHAKAMDNNARLRGVVLVSTTEESKNVDASSGIYGATIENTGIRQRAISLKKR